MKKVLLVGLGAMGAGHYFAHKGSRYSNLAAVCDINYDMAKEKLSNFQSDTPLFADMEEAIREVKPDVVDIVTPTYTHAELAIKAMEAGCDVLCEKPMALTVEDCRRMIEASERTGRRLMIAHVVRFMAPYMYLKSVAEGGRMGRLLRLGMKRISAIPRYNDWMQKFDLSGGVILDLSIHDVDFVTYLLGEPEKTSSVYYTQKDLTEFSTVDMIYPGASVSAESGWYKAYIPWTCGFVAVFEGGMISLSGDDLYENGNKIELSPDMPELALGFDCDTLDGYQREIEYFINRLESGEPFDAVTPESSLKTIALCRKMIDEAEKI